VALPSDRRGAPIGPDEGGAGIAGFLLGAMGMFATMYSTQAILPELARDFGVSPSDAGLTVSAVVVAIAVGAWIWGPVSDRIGRRRSLILASSLLVIPTVAAGLAPTFGVLLLCRTLQGLCMPGLLTVGVPYVAEAFAPRIGGRAMGYYVSALVIGGLIGRVGVALVTALVGWRWAVGGLAILPAVGAALMRRTLPFVAPPLRSEGGLAAVARQLRNATLLRAAAAGSALLFAFVGTFSYVVFRLEAPPFGFGTVAGSLVFLLWVLGAVGPFAGRLADRVGWQRVALAALASAALGVTLSLPALLPTLALALALVTVSVFTGVTNAQIGVTRATRTDRGVASAIYFSVYYLAGALAAYLPGLAWQRWGWPGVVSVTLTALVLAMAASVAGVRASPRDAHA
jgi:YNFM family putative membrane transporter